MALAGGATVAQAAAKSGVCERTLYRRLQEPEFQKRIDELRAEMVKRSAAMLIAAALLASKTRVDLQESSILPAVRRRAAHDNHRVGAETREVSVLERRIAVLENRKN